MRTFWLHICGVILLMYLCFSMTTLDHATHAIVRKGYAPHYTLANLGLFQPEIHDFTLELIKVRVICVTLVANAKDL
jgi:hypothetical protein